VVDHGEPVGETVGLLEVLGREAMNNAGVPGASAVVWTIP